MWHERFQTWDPTMYQIPTQITMESDTDADRYEAPGGVYYARPCPIAPSNNVTSPPRLDDDGYVYHAPTRNQPVEYDTVRLPVQQTSNNYDIDVDEDEESISYDVVERVSKPDNAYHNVHAFPIVISPGIANQYDLDL